MQSLGILIGRYSKIFNPTDTGSTEENTGGVGLFRKFGYLVVLDQLADGDATRYPYFEEMNTIKLLNLLLFRIEKAEEEKRQIELARLRAKL